MVKLKTLVGSLLVLLALGSVYSWSLFNLPLSEKYDAQIGSVAFTFGIMTLFLAIGSSLSGFLKLKISMQNTVALSAVCTGAGLLLAAFAPNLAVLYLSAGVLLGFGDGLGYMLVLTNCVKFFPKHKGLVSALCIGAYGLGSLLFKSIDSAIITHYSVENALLTWGIIIAVFTTLGSILILDAMQQSSVLSANTSTREYDLQSAIRTIPYWYLSIMFFIDCMVGLYVIGVSSNLGTALLNMSLADAATAVSVVALANIAGRLIMGVLSDRLPRIRLITFDQTLSLIAMLIMLLMPLTPVLFFTAIALIAFSFGGTLTIYPSIISDFFGIKNLAKNYGLLYLGFGIGSLFGYTFAVIFGSYTMTFIMMSVLLVAAIILSLMVKLPAELKDGHKELVKEHKLYNFDKLNQQDTSSIEPARESDDSTENESKVEVTKDAEVTAIKTSDNSSKDSQEAKTISANESEAENAQDYKASTANKLEAATNDSETKGDNMSENLTTNESKEKDAQELATAKTDAQDAQTTVEQQNLESATLKDNAASKDSAQSSQEENSSSKN